MATDVMCLYQAGTALAVIVGIREALSVSTFTTVETTAFTHSTGTRVLLRVRTGDVRTVPGITANITPLMTSTLRHT